MDLKALYNAALKVECRSTHENLRTGIRYVGTCVLVVLLFALSAFQVYSEGGIAIGFELSDVVLVTESEELIMQSENHIRLTDGTEHVSFSIDDLRGTPHLAHNTSVYYRGFVESSAYTTAFIDAQLDRYDYPVYICAFERAPLKNAPDLNSHFLHIEIELEEQILLSLHIASRQPISKIKWFSRLQHRDGRSLANLDYEQAIFENPKREIVHEKTKTYYTNVFDESDDVTWGIFDQSTQVDLTNVERIEDSTGMKLDIVLEYFDLDYLPKLESMKMIADSDRILELTFQTNRLDSFNQDIFYDVMDGKYDESIDQLIEIIKASDNPVLFRPNNEMNGDWCSYNALYTHKDTEVFKMFWKWLHGKFEENGATNVLWVWNPNWGDFPDVQWNHYINYYPGQDYVDIIGLTGYNTGTYYEAEKWRSFSEIYLPLLLEYNERFHKYPFMITEFGSSTTGGDKVKWIRSALNTIRLLDIKAAVWWNGFDYDTRNGVVSRHYKFDDDPEIIEIFKAHFSKLGFH